MFVPALEEGQSESDLEVETIVDMYRTNSSREVIDGIFELPGEGVIFFLWDNMFDWVSSKNLTYSIEVKQVSDNLNYVKQTL
jgi:hypothetical protein